MSNWYDPIVGWMSGAGQTVVQTGQQVVTAVQQAPQAAYSIGQQATSSLQQQSANTPNPANQAITPYINTISRSSVDAVNRLSNQVSKPVDNFQGVAVGAADKVITMTTGKTSEQHIKNIETVLLPGGPLSFTNKRAWDFSPEHRYFSTDQRSGLPRGISTDPIMGSANVMIETAVGFGSYSIDQSTELMLGVRPLQGVYGALGQGNEKNPYGLLSKGTPYFESTVQKTIGVTPEGIAAYEQGLNQRNAASESGKFNVGLAAENVLWGSTGWAVKHPMQAAGLFEGGVITNEALGFASSSISKTAWGQGVSTGPLKPVIKVLKNPWVQGGITATFLGVGAYQKTEGFSHGTYGNIREVSELGGQFGVFISPAVAEYGIFKYKNSRTAGGKTIAGDISQPPMGEPKTIDKFTQSGQKYTEKITPPTAPTPPEFTGGNRKVTRSGQSYGEPFTSPTTTTPQKISRGNIEGELEFGSGVPSLERFTKGGQRYSVPPPPEKPTWKTKNLDYLNDAEGTGLFEVGGTTPAKEKWSTKGLEEISEYDLFESGGTTPIKKKLSTKGLGEVEGTGLFEFGDVTPITPIKPKVPTTGWKKDIGTAVRFEHPHTPTNKPKITGDQWKYGNERIWKNEAGLFETSKTGKMKFKKLSAATDYIDMKTRMGKGGGKTRGYQKGIGGGENPFQPTGLSSEGKGNIFSKGEGSFKKGFENIIVEKKVSTTEDLGTVVRVNKRIVKMKQKVETKVPTLTETERTHTLGEFQSMDEPMVTHMKKPQYGGGTTIEDMQTINEMGLKLDNKPILQKQRVSAIQKSVTTQKQKMGNEYIMEEKQELKRPTLNKLGLVTGLGLTSKLSLEQKQKLDQPLKQENPNLLIRPIIVRTPLKTQEIIERPEIERTKAIKDPFTSFALPFVPLGGIGGGGTGGSGSNRGKKSWINRNRVAAQLPSWFYRSNPAGQKGKKKGFAKMFGDVRSPFD